MKMISARALDEFFFEKDMFSITDESLKTARVRCRIEFAHLG